MKCIFGPQRLVAGSVPNPAKSWDICWEIHSLHWTKPLSQFLIVKPVESLILMVISYLLYIHTNTHTHTPIHFDVSHAGQAILQVSPRPQPAPLPAAWPSSSSSPWHPFRPGPRDGHVVNPMDPYGYLFHSYGSHGRWFMMICLLNIVVFHSYLELLWGDFEPTGFPWFS